jgi:hypothetical protein
MIEWRNLQPERSWNRDRAGNLPDELKARRAWLCWMWKWRGDKRTKIPVRAADGRAASVTNPDDWCSFAEACDAYEQNTRFAGIGYVFVDEAGVSGLDLDKCLTQDDQGRPVLTDEAQALVTQAHSYTEITPSGTGLHVFLRGSVPAGTRRGTVELYPHGRFFTVTGYALPGHEAEAINGAEVLQRLYGGMRGRETGAEPRQPAAGAALHLSADASPPFDLFQALLDADTKFRRTWEGKRKDLADQSPSSFDLALASLAHRAQWPEQTICDLLIAWRRKHGHDLKLNREDYYARTIAKARPGVYESSSPPLPPGAAGEDDSSPRQRVSQAIGLPVTKIVQEGRTEATYYVELEGNRHYQIGDTAAYMDQKRWARLVVELTGKPFDAMKAPQWKALLCDLAELREVNDHDEGASAHRLHHILNGYLRSVDDDKKRAVRSFRPFIEDGCIHLNIDDLYQHITDGKLMATQPRELMAILRAEGWDRVSVSIREGEKVINRKYWSTGSEVVDF